MAVAMFHRIHDSDQASQKGPTPSDDASSPAKFSHDALKGAFKDQTDLRLGKLRIDPIAFINPM
ncbi:hypothetical protein OS493_010648 [Desmophyllum pertusum]|uniref:Uncharacterized protein n=1 Tax=Desmophyllum pertusum TaxID=174260 RepID=A0A9W9ZRN0_9CNID|nr:hypothetical protein OS493_010648 [Desmophyllum pertusum]